MVRECDLQIIRQKKIALMKEQLKAIKTIKKVDGHINKESKVM